MKIFFACDHAGFTLKEHLRVFVADLGYNVEDLGAHEFTTDDDYPTYIAHAAQKVSEAPEVHKAIVLGGSGQGEAIVANRFLHVRAVVYAGKVAGEESTDLDMLALTRAHNDANVLSLGARFLSEVEAEQAVKHWLETPFSGDERHVRRIAMIDDVSR